MSNGNLLPLDEQVSFVEADALSEERKNAKENYARLNKLYDDAKKNLLFPDIGKFTTAKDTNFTIEDLQEIKGIDNLSYEKMAFIRKYIDQNKLYMGHLCKTGDQHFYILNDRSNLDSCLLDEANCNVRLIHPDDRNFNIEFKMWRNARRFSEAEYSRIIEMEEKDVISVEVTYDRGSQLFSTIQDSYLRKALIRNKDNKEIHSIIQTIQNKQEEIRGLEKGKSLFVQGCAGSGKTMVLLHRMRMLLYNKEMFNEEYVLLVPSVELKKYLTDAAGEFNINPKNILTFAEYYRNVGTRSQSADIKEANELIFPAEYLKEVYSEKFLKECYYRFFVDVSNKADILIEKCDTELCAILNKKKQDAEKEIERTKKELVKHVERKTAKIAPNITTKIDGKYENIYNFLEDIKCVYDEAADKYSKAVESTFTHIDIADDDSRVLENAEVKHFTEREETEIKLLNGASIFVKAAHKRKLESIQAKLREAREEAKKEIAAIIQKDNEQKIEQYRYIFGGVTIDEVRDIIQSIEADVIDANTRLEKSQEVLENAEDSILEEISEKIEALNEFIEISASIEDNGKMLAESMDCCDEYLQKVLDAGELVYSYFLDEKTNQEENIDAKLHMFAEKTEAQRNAYAHTVFFNICRNVIKEKYNIKISNVYKHYWYLTLCCSYLTRGYSNTDRRYIFIDEVQDLSPMEIQIITSVNRKRERNGKIRQPIINMFGDVNQTISQHGLMKTNDMPVVCTKYELSENFRNTNQIISYCNNRLPFYMEKVGIDMNDVVEYSELQDLVWDLETQTDERITFIVKDEVAATNVNECLRGVVDEFEILTVKMAKGLEFKKVYVIDKDMSDNEKYIAYTRAMAELCVIHSMPDLNVALPQIVEGQEEVWENQSKEEY